jgi:hypothetical protein
MRSLHNFVHRAVEKFSAGRHSERHGLVTSYNPQTHLAKVTFQPEGMESGWLPIETSHIGNGWGDLVGLTPGSGQGSSSSVGGSTSGGTSSGGGTSGGGGAGQGQGDQVIVRLQEGDFEAGKIVQRVHSDVDIPPIVQQGEMLRKHKNGAKMYFDGNGAVTFYDKTNNGQGYSNNFADASATGGGSSGFTPGGSSSNRDQVQKPELAQSVSITMDGKGHKTTIIYDQTNQGQSGSGASGSGTSGSGSSSGSGGGVSVQQAQQGWPPPAHAHIWDGSANKGYHSIVSYRQGAQRGGTATPPQPPLPPPACHTHHGCDGGHKVETYQDLGNQPGQQPPLATQTSRDSSGKITHTTWYKGQNQAMGNGAGGGAAGGGGGGGSGGSGGSGGTGSTTQTTPQYGSAGVGPILQANFQPPQASMSTQTQHDGQGNLTHSTYEQQGSNGQQLSTKVTMDGKGNMTLHTYQKGSEACKVSMDSQGNMHLECLKQGELKLTNNNGHIALNTSKKITFTAAQGIEHNSPVTSHSGIITAANEPAGGTG